MALSLITARQAIEDLHDARLDNRLAAVEADYDRMKDFMQRGFKDDTRDLFYNGLCRNIFRILLEAEGAARARNLGQREPTYDGAGIDIDELRSALEGYVADLAVASIDVGGQDGETNIRERHAKKMRSLFNAVVFSRQWPPELAVEVAGLLVSPTVDVADAQLLVSAITLGCLSAFDPAKTSSLLHVYRKAADEHVRQRALVGWTLAIDNADAGMFPDICDEVATALKDEHTREQLLELQMQMMICLNAEADAQTMRQDIMPGIIKNQNIEITRLGIKEKEDDTLEDILHPDAADKRIEELEKTVKRIMDMQKRGADIHFGGFSLMKHFPFFSDLCNWFMPFSTEHPAVRSALDKIGETKLLRSILATESFCDSDKYSFTFGLATVINNLPANIKEAMNGEMGDRMSVTEHNGSDASMIRLMYLQDLYRFFRLNSMRTAFRQIFPQKALHLFFLGEAFRGTMTAEARRLTQFLLKKGYAATALKLLDAYGIGMEATTAITDGTGTDAADLLLRGTVEMRLGKSLSAFKLYQQASSIDPDNEAALKGLATSGFACGNYSDAAEAFGKLSTMHPDDIRYRLNQSISLINGGKAEEGVPPLHRLAYEAPDNLDIRRALAWGLLWMKNLEEAVKQYDRILSAGNATSDDRINAGYCAWFNGDCDKASELFALAVGGNKKIGREELIRQLEKQFAADTATLDLYAISPASRRIMADIASTKA